MRYAFSMLIIGALTGCSVVPPQAWNFDPTRPQPRAAAPETAGESPLADRVAELQAQRREIRQRIATEPDVWKRQAHYAQLHQVGIQLSPLERQLTGGSRR